MRIKRNLSWPGQIMSPGYTACSAGSVRASADINLDIPTLMRSYMYAYGYRNLHHAQQTVEMVDLSGNTCNQCDECTVNCKAGFNLKSKISDIARLKDVPSDFLMA